MKKPLLAGVGVVGACAACCAVPLALPILSGLSAAGFLGIAGWDQLSGTAWAGVAAGAALVAGLTFGISRLAKGRAPACSMPGTSVSQGGSCGCAPKITA